MGWKSRKWVILVAATWIMAFTGTNSDFSLYSSELKSVLGITQLQLNDLSMASDMGKAFGWCSGVLLVHFPLWVVMFMAAFMSLFGYGLQWLAVLRLVSLPFFLVFVLCLLVGCSICWFNTLCYILCIKNFSPPNRPLALSLTISFNGLTAALYTLIANTINPNNNTLYLLLNTLLPFIVTLITIIPIVLHQPLLDQPLNSDTIHRDSIIILCLHVLAGSTGLYLLFNSLSPDPLSTRILFYGSVFLLVLPLCLSGLVYARKSPCRIHNRFCLERSSFVVDPDDLEVLHMELVNETGSTGTKEGCHGNVSEKDSSVLGEEFSARRLVRRLDFWLYYIAYLCGGTIGLVYSNNLGQISESLGYSSLTGSLVTFYSSCSFIGRLLSSASDFFHEKLYLARTGWLFAALVPTPIAIFLLATLDNEAALCAGTGLIGISSGFVFSAAVSITSELFGPNSAGINHNLLITNIPIGSLLYGFFAAMVYDSNAADSNQRTLSGYTFVCIGRKCYLQTFIWWGCISLVGLISSFLLFRRTKHAYNRFSERNRY